MNEVFEELRTALYSVWHRKWLALAVAWGVCLLGWLIVAIIPNSYEAKARIYVDVDDVLSEQLGIAGDGREEIMTRFDFGRSKTGSGPYNYKKNWGFEPTPLVYGEWTAPGREARNVDPTSESYSRKIELWKKLPLPVANAIGPWIARGLA